MNVINDDAVQAFCESVAARATREGLRLWCLRNLRRHALNDPSLHEPVRPEGVEALLSSGEIQAAPPWLGEAVARGDALWLFRPLRDEAQALQRSAWRVVDHRNACDADMARVSVTEAIAAAEAWERAEAGRRVAAFAKRRKLTLRQATALLSRTDAGVAKLWPESAGDVSVTVPLPGGHSLVEILTQDAIVREGTLMDHCVATYWEAVSDGRVRILSLRDPDNLPQATLEVAGVDHSRRGIHRIVRSHLPRDLAVAWQVRGIANAPPSAAALGLISAAMDASGLAASEEEVRWLGLDPRHSFMTRIDLPGLAEAMRSHASDQGNPAFLAAARMLLERVDSLDDASCRHLVTALAPAAGKAPETEWLSREPAAIRLTWTVPNLLLTSRLEGLLRRSPESVREAFIPFATAIVAEAEARPEACHAVRPSLGTWRSERPFFAWCGLDARWSEALARSAETRRASLRASQAEMKRRLREDPLGEEERRRLLNVINVSIPRLLAA